MLSLPFILSLICFVTVVVVVVSLFVFVQAVVVMYRVFFAVHIHSSSSWAIVYVVLRYITHVVITSIFSLLY